MSDLNPEEFIKMKDKADVFYKSVGSIRCPALDAEVHFTSDGFHHLQFDGTRTERTKIVQKNKMLCLQEAVTVIKKSTTVQEYRTEIQPVGKRDKNGFRVTKRVQYYAFRAITDFNKLRRVVVVIRRVGEGNLHFWSVMPSWKEEEISDTQKIRKVGGEWLKDE